MSRVKVNPTKSIGVFGLLGVAFIVLKIIKVDPIGDWSWWWVTAPLWGPTAFWLMVLVAVLLIAAATGAKVRVR